MALAGPPRNHENLASAKAIFTPVSTKGFKVLPSPNFGELSFCELRRDGVLRSSPTRLWTLAARVVGVAVELYVLPRRVPRLVRIEAVHEQEERLGLRAPPQEGSGEYILQGTINNILPTCAV
jgi:hypothetical protein